MQHSTTHTRAHSTALVDLDVVAVTDEIVSAMQEKPGTQYCYTQSTIDPTIKLHTRNKTSRQQRQPHTPARPTTQHNTAQHSTEQCNASHTRAQWNHLHL